MKENNDFDKTYTKLFKKKKRNKIIAICSTVGATVLIATGLMLYFLLPKADKLYINLNSDIENVSLVGDGNYSVGDRVTIKAGTVEGYQFVCWTLDDKIVSTDVEYTFEISEETAGAYLANYEKLYKITVGTLENGTVSTVSKAVKGEIVSLTVSPATNYELDKLYYIKKGSTQQIDIINNSFTMPKADVTIYATFKRALFAISKEIENGEIEIQKTGANLGEEISFSVTPKEMDEDFVYVLERVYYEFNNIKHDLTSETNTYKFEMPSSDVKIGAEIKKGKIFKDYKFSNSNITAYTGTETNIILPSSYSQIFTDVTEIYANIFTINDMDEFNSYGEFLQVGGFWITIPGFERTYIGVGEVETVLFPMLMSFGDNMNAAFPMIVEDLFDFEISYEEYQTMCEAATIDTFWDCFSKIEWIFSLLNNKQIDKFTYQIGENEPVEVTTMMDYYDALEAFELSIFSGFETASTDEEYFTAFQNADRACFPIKFSNLQKVTVVYDGNETPIVGIGERVFENNSNLTSINIPEGIINIGDAAFLNCINLTSVTIPEGVAIIGNSAFFGCSNLENVNMPSSVTSIGSSAFYNCSNLTSIIIPEGVTAINSSSFQGCTNLTSVTIPEGVINIGNAAFAACSLLKSVKLPNSLINLGEQAFQGSAITEIDLSNTVVTTLKFQTFIRCNSLNNVTLPNNLKIIEGNVFWECTSLTEINLPGTLESLGNSAFNKSGLVSIDLSNTKITTLNLSTFSGCKSLTTAKLPASLESIGNFVFTDSGLTEIDLSGTKLTSIGIGAFESCEALTTLITPNTFFAINEHAFSNSISLTNVIINNNRIYTSQTSLNDVKSIIRYATTIRVLKSIVDDEGNVNNFLNNANNYTKSEDGEYYVYTKAVA